MNEKKINVLQFICPTGFYGAERWIIALANNSLTEDVNNELAVTEELDEQNLEIVNQFPRNAEIFKVPMNGRFDLSVISKLSNIIKQQNIDIIHTHGYKSDILGLWVAKITGIKCVSTPHGFGLPEDFKSKVFIRLGIFSLRFFNKVVPLSKQLMDEVLASGVAKERCQYIRNAVDLTEIDKFLVTKKPKDPLKKKQVGFIGQMIPRKNIKDALDVFNQLWLKNNNMEFLLLGDGDSREELEKYARTLASSGDIKFLGFRNDRMDILKNLDLFIMTSKDEGIPRCLMEACAMEIPIAAYNISGIDQLITHEETGLLADFGDKETLELYWEKLLNNNDYSEKLAKSARQFVLNKFSGQRMAKEYADLFKEVLKM